MSAPGAAPQAAPERAELVLFDVDGTLLLTDGDGPRAFLAAAAAVLGRPPVVDGMRFGGGLDPLLFRALARASGVEEPEPLLAPFRSAYGRELEARLARRAARALAGARELVETLAAAGAAVGLLTGNFPETGARKLASAGFALEAFDPRVWGEDGPERRALVPVALARAARRLGASPHPARVVVVGDTPHDVDCARAAGCRSLAVATGRSSPEELTAAGADRVVADLAEAEGLARWILGG